METLTREAGLESLTLRLTLAHQRFIDRATRNLQRAMERYEDELLEALEMELFPKGKHDIR